MLALHLAEAVPGRRRPALVPLAVALSLVIAGLLAPWIGAAADRSGRRRAMLAAATLVCGAATALLFTVGKSAIGLYIGGAGIAGSFGAAAASGAAASDATSGNLAIKRSK